MVSVIFFFFLISNCSHNRAMGDRSTFDLERIKLAAKIAKLQQLVKQTQEEIAQNDEEIRVLEERKKQQTLIAKKSPSRAKRKLDITETCSHCDKQFVSYRTSVTHVKSNLTPKTKCCHCSKEYYYNHLHSHHTKHSKLSVNECPTCSVSYKNAFDEAKQWEKDHQKELDNTFKEWFAKKKSRK